jgi:hypothetical protein
MDSLFAWELGGGSDELLTALGRMTLLFTAADQVLTAIIHGYIEINPSLASVLGKVALADVAASDFSRKPKWLKAILEQMDGKIEGHKDVRDGVRDVGSLNADRRAYTHGLVRLTKEGKLIFQNKEHKVRATDIDGLNDRMRECMGSIWGQYTIHCMYLHQIAETKKFRDAMRMAVEEPEAEH